MRQAEARNTPTNAAVAPRLRCRWGGERGECSLTHRRWGLLRRTPASRLHLARCEQVPSRIQDGARDEHHRQAHRQERATRSEVLHRPQRHIIGEPATSTSAAVTGLAERRDLQLVRRWPNIRRSELLCGEDASYKQTETWRWRPGSETITLRSHSKPSPKDEPL